MRTFFLPILIILTLPPVFCQSGDSSKPFVLGTIVQIPSVQLSETRQLNIYLPAGYNANDTVRYPVIYLLDGSADEDFISVAGLLHYNTFPWVNRVPASILVGICNTDRKKDFTYPSTFEGNNKKYPTTGHSEQFIAFIEKELQPFIDKKYKTNASRTLIGESLGGLLATEILVKHPWLFNKYVIISPSLWWDDASILKQVNRNLKDTALHPIAVYIGVGKEGPAPTLTPHVMETDARLLADKIKALGNPKLTVHFDYLPEENHATISFPARFNAFRLLYPKPKE